MSVLGYDARERYLARRDRGAPLRVVTPEGVPIQLTVAPAGDRIVAFVLDALIIAALLALLVLFTLVGLVVLETAKPWLVAFGILAVFLLRNFYFAFFELRWQGRTPGKRMVGIRVIDARGGPLRARAVLVRNLTREVELYLPLGVLAMPEMLWPGAPAGGAILAGLWTLVFAFMPLFNRERRRLGDLLAGTAVVITPVAILLRDIGERGGAELDARVDAPPQFSSEQLETYGIYELQVLEELLRDVRRIDKSAALEVVAKKIQSKIGWGGGEVHPRAFLRDFYTALRADLERRMLLGERREDKHAGRRAKRRSRPTRRP